MAKEEVEEFLDAAHKMSRAMSEFLDAWFKVDRIRPDPTDMINKGYPFHKDFQELVLNVSGWVSALDKRFEKGPPQYLIMMKKASWPEADEVEEAMSLEEAKSMVEEWKKLEPDAEVWHQPV